MLSTFESALLDRHLRGCPDCNSFARDAQEQTRLLRGALLERPTRPVVVSESEQRGGPRRAAGVLSACLVAAAAAAVLVWPGARTGSSGQAEGFSGRVGAPVLVTYSADPSSTSSSVEVPRLKLQPASIADGPVHGYFSTPV
jgi:predicted anti-sigma-YlaC factor YlaD